MEVVNPLQFTSDSEWLKTLCINRFITLAFDPLALHPIDLKSFYASIWLIKSLIHLFKPISMMSNWLSHKDWEKQLSGAAAAAPYHLMSLVPLANQISGDIRNHSDPESWPLIGRKKRKSEKEIKEGK